MKVNEHVALLVPAVADKITVTTFEGQMLRIRAADIAAVQDLPALPKSTVYTGARAAIFFLAQMVIVRSTAQAVDALIDAAVSPSPTGIVLIQDQKAIGVEGGTATNGAWRTRDLNTKVYDADGLASISANQITLAAGFYHVWAWANGLRVGHHKIRLRDMAGGGTTLLEGVNARSITTDSTTTMATMAGPISLAIQAVLELQHRVSTTQATFGWGADMQAGFDINVYSSILFRRA